MELNSSLTNSFTNLELEFKEIRINRDTIKA
jgi:hypothetical protein